jgi:hypothetical protein
LEKPPVRNYTRIALAALAALLVIGAAVYGVEMSTAQSHTTLSSGGAISQSSASTSGAAISTPGDEPTSYINDTLIAQEESAGLVNCTTQEEAFLNDGPIYSELGYPLIPGNGDSAFSYPEPAFVYFVQFPNGPGLDVNLGNVQMPMISACQALGDAIDHLGVDPQNYSLAAVSINDAELNIGFPTLEADWIFYFAQLHQGYWVDSPGEDTDEQGIGLAAAVTVNAVSGHTTGGVNAVSLPSGADIALNLNASQAIQVVRHTTKMNEGPDTVANGTVYSMELRLATIRAVSGGSYVHIEPVTNTTTAGQIGLVWIITTSFPNYVGFFVVDARTGQVVEAEGESTLPCGGAPNCGTMADTLIPIGAYPDYGRTQGMNVSTESFEVNGSALGINGDFPVDVPHVVVMSQGSSGSMEVSFTGNPNICTGNCTPFTDEYLPSLSTMPSGVSMNFSETNIPVPASGTANDTLHISVSPSAAQGTYIVFFEFPGPGGGGYATSSGYLILSVWDGQGPWPVLPMLSVPLLDGQPQPIIFNTTSTSS